MESNSTVQLGEAIGQAINNEENGIRKEYGALTLSRVYKGTYDTDGFKTAELKQKVTTHYPSKSIANDMDDSLFGSADFGESIKGQSYDDTRVAWIAVPESFTEDQVREVVSKFTNAKLYRVMSNHPIVDSAQAAAINNSKVNLTLDVIANSQATRYPDGHENALQIVTDNVGKIQYRRVCLSKDGSKSDVDRRTSDPTDFYITEELKAELASGVVEVETGQEI